MTPNAKHEKQDSNHVYTHTFSEAHIAPSTSRLSSASRLWFCRGLDPRREDHISPRFRSAICAMAQMKRERPYGCWTTYSATFHRLALWVWDKKILKMGLFYGWDFEVRVYKPNLATLQKCTACLNSASLLVISAGDMPTHIVGFASNVFCIVAGVRLYQLKEKMWGLCKRNCRSLIMIDWQSRFETARDAILTALLSRLSSWLSLHWLAHCGVCICIHTNTCLLVCWWLTFTAGVQHRCIDRIDRSG